MTAYSADTASASAGKDNDDDKMEVEAGSKAQWITFEFAGLFLTVTRSLGIVSCV